MTTRRKTNPDHKARFNIGVEAVCSCGWKSSMWLNAAGEFRAHRATCEVTE
jgi:hypothetical protein